MHAIIRLTARSIERLNRIPLDFLALLMRIIMGKIFLFSALTKVDGLSISQSTFFLFEYEYALPLIPAGLAAYLATIGEFTFSLLLWAGLATRFAATGMLLMTITIQLFVYPDAWVTHGLWASCLLYLIFRGPGVLSLDHLIAKAPGKR